VPPDATADTIKSRFKRLAKSTHPDVNRAADAAEQFVAIKKAYDTLSQDMLRAEHDQQLGERVQCAIQAAAHALW